MKKIIFHGVLGEKFGKEFVLDVESAAEAMYALSCQIRGLEKFIRLNNFHVWADEINLAEECVGMRYDSEVFRFALHVEGAGGGGGGLLAVVAGLAIIAVGFWNPMNWGIGATLLMGAGAGIASVGLASMLMPKASTATIDEEGNRSSYSFGGAVTTTAQGNPYPISYGECMGGGFIMSVRIRSSNLPD